MRQFPHDYDPRAILLIRQTIDEGEEESIEELWDEMIGGASRIEPSSLIFDILALICHFYCSQTHDHFARKWLPRLTKIYQDNLRDGGTQRWMVVDGWALARLSGDVALSQRILETLRTAHQQGTDEWWKDDWVAWGVLHLDTDSRPLQAAEAKIRRAERCRSAGQDVVRSARTMIEIVKAIRDHDQDAFDAAWAARAAFWAEEAEDNDPTDAIFLCDIVGTALGFMAEERGLTVEPDAYRDLDWWRGLR